MVRREVEVLIGVRGLPIDRDFSTPIFLHMNTYIQEWELVVKFRFCGELNVAVYAVYMCSETIHMILMYIHKRIVHISEPHRGGTWCRRRQRYLLEILPVEIAHYGGYWGSHGGSVGLLVERVVVHKIRCV